MIFLVLLLSAFAHADCDDLRIQGLENVDFSHDSAPTVDFRVHRDGRDECKFFVTADNGGAPSAFSRVLRHDNHVDSVPVQICIDSSCGSVLKHFPEASSPADVLSGTISRGDNDERTLVFRPRLGAFDYPRYGEYEADFTMRLYSGTLEGSHHLEDTDSFRLRYYMTKRIDLSIVNPGGTFDKGAVTKTMNFGALNEGQQMEFDLLVKTNAGYRVRMESENEMRLRYHQYTVPYSLTINGAAVTLADEATVAQGAGVSTAAGHRFQGRIRIGALGSARPGNYSDIITVKVSTTE